MTAVRAMTLIAAPSATPAWAEAVREGSPSTVTMRILVLTIPAIRLEHVSMSPTPHRAMMETLAAAATFASTELARLVR